MKKIGILTTYFAANYGAALQPFALKRTLEKMGYDVEMLPYKQKSIYNVYNPLYYRKFFCHGFIKFCSSVINLIYTLPREWRFQQYIKKYITPKSLTTYVDPNKDAYFVGSDQLWKPFPPENEYDDVYCGFFQTKVGAKKIAYAVSGEIPCIGTKDVAYLTKAFDNFDMISVRETIRAEQFGKFYKKKKIEVVADPTILADPQIYDSIDCTNVNLPQRFVLFYCIRSAESFIDKIYEYAQSHNCILLVLSEGFNRALLRFTKKHINTLYNPRAGEEFFLAAIKNADAVFTPSFHGNVFSILYHRNLHCLVLNDGCDNRARELLNSLNISNRFFERNQVFIDNPVDWEEVEEKLALLRTKAHNYIERALKLLEEK